MKGLIDYTMTHPAAIAGVIFLLVVILYFLLKKLVKFALVVIIILVLVTGYLYVRSGDSVKEAVRKVGADAGNIIEKGKGTYEKGKRIYEKGKELTEGVDKFLGKGEEKKKVE